MQKLKKILIIAGSDPSGGAGIQADIKTACAHQVYSSSVITCLTAQNTQKVVTIHTPPISFLRTQIETLLDDINFDVIKIGMLGTSQVIHCIADILDKRIPLVLDTVMISTSGDSLLRKSAVDALKSRLISSSYLVTPNIDEAEILADMKIGSLEEMQVAARRIKNLGAKNVLVKGGHLSFADKNIYNILLDEKDKIHIITNKKIGHKNIHGTGCALATSIACNIAKKIGIIESVRKANDYVYNAIIERLRIGNGSLVLRHFYK